MHIIKMGTMVTVAKGLVCMLHLESSSQAATEISTIVKEQDDIALYCHKHDRIDGLSNAAFKLSMCQVDDTLRCSRAIHHLEHVKRVEASLHEGRVKINILDGLEAGF